MHILLRAGDGAVHRAHVLRGLHVGTFSGRSRARAPFASEVADLCVVVCSALCRKAHRGSYRSRATCAYRELAWGARRQGVPGLSIARSLRSGRGNIMFRSSGARFPPIRSSASGRFRFHPTHFPSWHPQGAGFQHNRQ